MNRCTFLGIAFSLFCSNLAFSAPQLKGADKLGELLKAIHAAAKKETITLSAGNDFEAAPGTIIFMPRQEGMAHLIQHAKEDDEEIHLLYLPQWEAWITQTISRSESRAEIDPKYLAAIAAADIRVELWHTHVDKNIVYESEEAKKENPLFWIVPSTLDLNQLIVYGNQWPKAKMRGVVVSKYGALSFWMDDYSWFSTAPPQFVGPTIRDIASHLQFKVRNAKPTDLEKIAADFRGIVALKFEPAVNKQQKNR